MGKVRFIAITDIFYGFEVDDIQSMIRLLLYSNDIDIEGLISCTSCFVKDGADEHVKIIHDLIDAYAKVRDNLKVHADGWPEAEYLHSVTCDGISVFGKRPGKGFAESIFNNNAGVNRIIAAADKQDDRPLYIGLWGGANTLAQAIWKISKTRDKKQLDAFLSKLRIISISDQDYSGRWIRDNFGDRLFYNVAPSKGSWFGNWQYWRATWPGISGDNFKNGSEDGTKTKGFTGADTQLVSDEWVREYIQSKGLLGSLYPTTKYILEGDTPTYLGLIPNGLNEPERPDYGGWGGRYKFYIPPKAQFGIKEKYPIWCTSYDNVKGIDGKMRCSYQATIWRWRKDFQYDFAARMEWSVTDDYSKAAHPPVIRTGVTEVSVKAGSVAELEAVAVNPNGGECECKWYNYREAGSYGGDVTVLQIGSTAKLTVPHDAYGKTLHIIFEATVKGDMPLTRYARFVITVD